MYGDRFGNKTPEDAEKYAGEGMGQITGMPNLRATGDRLGVDLISDPKVLERDPMLSARAMIEFNLLNHLVATNNRLEQLRIDYNGGKNGLPTFGVDVINLDKILK